MDASVSQHIRPIAVAIGAGVAAVALAIGGAFPASAAPDAALTPAGVDAVNLDAADCDSLAAACAWDLTPIIVSHAGDGTRETYLRFTAPTTGAFKFTSSNQTGNVDFVAWVVDSAGEELASGNGNTATGDFQLSIDLKAGTVYHLVVGKDNEWVPGSLTITYSAADPCTTVGNACSWDLAPKYISNGAVRIHDLKFVAPASGSFTFTSSHPASPSIQIWAAIWDDNSDLVPATFGPPGEQDFAITASLTAGKSYTLDVGWESASNTGGFTIKAKGPGIPNLFLSTATWNPTAAAQSMTVNVTTVNGAVWSVSSNVPWLATSALGATSLVVSVAANQGITRSGFLKVAAGGESAQIAVTQAGDPNYKPPLEKIGLGTAKIKGKLKVGKTLKAKVSTSTKGVKFSYTWYRNGKMIKGATKASYKLKKADRGKKITVKITARKSGMLKASVTSKAVKVPKK